MIRESVKSLISFRLVGQGQEGQHPRTWVSACLSEFAASTEAYTEISWLRDANASLEAILTVEGMLSNGVQEVSRRE